MALLILFVACRPDTSDPFDQIQQHLNAQQPRQAQYHLEVIAHNDGWTSDLHHQAGDIAAMMDDDRRALAHWEAVEPKSQALLQRMADSYLALGMWTDAVTTLDQLIVLMPEDATIHYRLGLLRAPFDPAGAMAHFETAADDDRFSIQSRALIATLDTHRDDPLLSMHVGLALANLDLWRYAEHAFRHAALLDYPEAIAYTALARQEQDEDGRMWLQRALDLAPENPRVQFVNGLYLRGTGNEQGSIRAFVNALAADPTNPALAAELGTAYRLDDQIARAEYWYRTALTLSGGDSLYQQLLADFYVGVGVSPTESRVDVLQLALEARPDDPALRAALGWALYSEGQRDAGLQQTEQALDLAPSDLYAIYYRGLIAVEQGETDLALNLLTQVAESQSPLAHEASSLVLALRPE